MVCCFPYESRSMISGRWPLITQTARDKSVYFSVRCISQLKVLIRAFAMFICIKGLYVVLATANIYLCFFFSSLFYFHIFTVAILLLKWSCPDRLLSASISWSTQPCLSWGQNAGTLGTSGCSCCWWFCFGLWGFTYIIWASGSSFRPSQFLLQSKYHFLHALPEYFYK